ncbi:hypothetical protein QJS10_CPB14g00248 [Acorus calamus]|uniref:Uncharacterized protein n=1 Tax=Acorus calamus TaxID=4465 RepID=A0AAV9DCJ4_ACOCL|nr:hypothetical protein QJS10_CPB14g00248 [Acorus calamus]
MATTSTHLVTTFLFMSIMAFTMADLPECPYPCLPPPAAVTNCPPPPPSLPSQPPPSPPTPSGGSGSYYFSPPPPLPQGYFPFNPPPPFVSFPAPPPPNPILPYFPFYFKTPPSPSAAMTTFVVPSVAYLAMLHFIMLCFLMS